MKYIYIVAFFTICSCQSNVQVEEGTDISKEEIEIAKGLIQGAFDDIWAGLDSTKILKYHSPDFVILENGELWDNDRIKQYMRKSLLNENRAKRINEMEYLSIEKYGPSMQIAYNNFAKFLVQDSIVGKAHWLESALAVKNKNGWKLKMMHSTYVSENN